MGGVKATLYNTQNYDFRNRNLFSNTLHRVNRIRWSCRLCERQNQSSRNQSKIKP